VAQLLVWFVLLLYVPTLLFRRAAKLRVDLAPRPKGLNQIEDFFAAAVPAVILNILAWLFVNMVTLWLLAERTAALPFLLTSDAASVLRNHLPLVVAYYITVLAFSAYLGWLYGWAESQLILSAAFVQQLKLANEKYRVAFAIHGVCELFFGDEREPLYPWTVNQTYMFVRTTDRLYHGRIYRYDRGSDGAIAGLLLDEVSRFTLKSREAALAADEPFATLFSGTLWLKWSTITDINAADVWTPATFNKVIAKYEIERSIARKRKNSPWMKLRRLML